MLIKPYGDKDPYSELELIACTEMCGGNYIADQMPVLSARVSHAGSGKTGEDREVDKKLMKFLADHKHMTPFEHQTATFRVVAPLFVFREWHRHRTQSYNEMSMRYTSDPVGKLYHPQEWRKQESRNKQSSAGTLSEQQANIANMYLDQAYNSSIDAYNRLIDLGVCREQARIVVPVGNYSEMYATANLRNWFAFWVLRSDKNAQKEIREYSDAIDLILRNIWPNSWNTLKESYYDKN